MAAKKHQEYGNESISALKGADRVRKRPGVIFGSDGLEGCEHSAFEILSNSIDEAREGFGSRIQNALREGWSGFVETVQSVAVFLVGHWPFIVVGAVCGVIFYKVRHPKHKKQK